MTGALIDHAPNLQIGYTRYSIFFVVVAIIGLCLSFCLVFVPDKVKFKLDRTSEALVVMRADGGVS